MPGKFKYELKRKVYRKHDSENMPKVMAAVESKKMFLRRAGDHYNIHFAVINWYLKRKGTLKSQRGQPVLNENGEASLYTDL